MGRTNIIGLHFLLAVFIAAQLLFVFHSHRPETHCVLLSDLSNKLNHHWHKSIPTNCLLCDFILNQKVQVADQFYPILISSIDFVHPIGSYFLQNDFPKPSKSRGPPVVEII
jgi:hypothetical protein